MAKAKEITIRMSRKTSDDNYGSFGVEGEIILEFEKDDDKDEMWAYGTSWLSAKLAGTHKAHGTVPSPTESVAVVANTQGARDCVFATYPCRWEAVFWNPASRWRCCQTSTRCTERATRRG